MKVTTTKAEFDRWWDECLGDDWYISEWDGPDSPWEAPAGTAEDEPVTFSFIDLDWQSDGDPTPTAWLTASDLASDRVDWTAVPVRMFRRWRATQETGTATFTVKVPAEHVAAFREWTAAHDSHVTGAA